MPVTRDAATAFIVETYPELLTEVGLSAANLGPTVDRSLLALAVDYGDLETAEVANADAAAFYDILEYFGAVRLLNAVMNRVDISLDESTSAKRSQLVAALQKRIPDLKAAVDGHANGSGWQVPVAINLDYLEPAL